MLPSRRVALRRSGDGGRRILNLPFPYVCALLHLEFTGITIIRMDRNPGAVALPCLELGNDGKHIHGTSYHRLADM